MPLSRKAILRADAQLKKYKAELRNDPHRDIMLQDILFKAIDNVFLNIYSNHSDESLTKSLIALKRIFKVAKHPGVDLSYLSSLGNAIEREQYDKVIASYDREFSDADWDKAALYFKNNPTDVFCGSKEGLMYSYIIADGELFRREKTLGTGSFGRTKSGETRSGTIPSSAIKRQMKSPSDDASWLPDVVLEAKINRDLSVATSDLLISLSQ